MPMHIQRVDSFVADFLTDLCAANSMLVASYLEVQSVSNEMTTSGIFIITPLCSYALIWL